MIRRKERGREGEQRKRKWTREKKGERRGEEREGEGREGEEGMLQKFPQVLFIFKLHSVSTVATYVITHTHTHTHR